MPDIDQEKPLHVMAFDFGLKRTGVAMGQSLIQTSQGLETLAMKNEQPHWDVVVSLIEKWCPDLLLVGLPLAIDGAETVMSTKARQFARRLHGRMGIKTIVWDERFSSYQAKHEQPASNYRQHSIDSLAAQYVLASWFNNDMPMQLP